MQPLPDPTTAAREAARVQYRADMAAGRTRDHASLQQIGEESARLWIERRGVTPQQLLTSRSDAPMWTQFDRFVQIFSAAYRDLLDQQTHAAFPREGEGEFGDEISS